MRRFSLLLALILFAPAFAEPPAKEARIQKKDRKHYRKAQEYFFFEEYDRAMPLLEKLTAEYPDNSIIHFEMGVCLYYSPTGKMKSLPWFEKALMLAGDNASPELFYYAGTCYQMQNRFDDAIRCYEGMKKQLDTPDEQKSMDRLIASCNNGKKYMAAPLNVRVENLGDNVNSPYPDYAPVFTGDEKLLLFTSKRKGTTGGNIDDDGHYFEDVYMSRNVSEGGAWSAAGQYDSSYTIKKKGPFRFLFSKAENVSEINTHEHDGSIAVSPDGQKLYIFRYSDVWVATVNENGRWSKPKRLHESIDGKSSHEPSLCLSSDGNTIYFVSDRPGGIGGKDIYRAERTSDGNWGAPVNLGFGVNTPYDEESPSLSEDGQTLYFSSEGHASMGGFDVFKAKLVGSKWSEAENLGYPINNGGDDLFFVPGKKGAYGYYASLQHNSLGDLDIYAIEYLEQMHRMWVKLIDNDNNRPVSDARVWYTKGQNGRKNLLEISPDGFAQFNFDPGATYSISIEREGYRPASSEITIADDPRLDNLYQEIRFSFTRDESKRVTGQEIQLSTALFNVDKEMNAPGSDMNVSRSAFMAALDKNNPRPDLKVTTLSEKYPESASSGNGADGAVFNTVYFDFEKTELNEEARVELDRAADYMKRNRAERFDIYGYTDAKGSENFNLQLSEKRAQAVRGYLISKGVGPGQLEIIAKGKSDPAGVNDTEEGRRKNRRVEIRIRK